MLRKLLAALGVGKLRGAPAAGVPPHSPYPESEGANDIYNLLFCDLPDRFKPAAGQKPSDWQDVFCVGAFHAAKAGALADDPAIESRIRSLACAALRRVEDAVTKKCLPGGIVAVPLDKGLRVLAVDVGGRARYVNHTNRSEPGFRGAIRERSGSAAPYNVF